MLLYLFKQFTILWSRRFPSLFSAKFSIPRAPIGGKSCICYLLQLPWGTLGRKRPTVARSMWLRRSSSFATRAARGSSFAHSHGGDSQRYGTPGAMIPNFGEDGFGRSSAHSHGGTPKPRTPRAAMVVPRSMETTEVLWWLQTVILGHHRDPKSLNLLIFLQK